MYSVFKWVIEVKWNNVLQVLETLAALDRAINSPHASTQVTHLQVLHLYMTAFYGHTVKKFTSFNFFAIICSLSAFLILDSLSLHKSGHHDGSEEKNV